MSENLSLNMNDPNVRSLLGNDDRIAKPGERKRSMVQLAGDAPDPTGYTANRGLMSTQRLDTGKQIAAVVFKDQVLEVDVYQLEGQPLELHYICPRCQNQGRITSDHKAMQWEPGSTRPVKLPDGRLLSFDRPVMTGDADARHMLTNAGTLSVEAFECAWEHKGADKHTPGIRAGGLTLCRLRLVIDQNVAREA